MKTAISLIFVLFGSLLIYSNAQCYHRHYDNNNSHLRYVPIPYNSNGKNPAAALTAALLSARALNGDKGLEGLRMLQTLQALQGQNRVPTTNTVNTPFNISPQTPYTNAVKTPFNISPQTPYRIPTRTQHTTLI